MLGLFRRKPKPGLYKTGLHFPWHLKMNQHRNCWNIVNDNKEIVCELVTCDRETAERMVQVLNADNEARRQAGYERWLWGK